MVADERRWEEVERLCNVSSSLLIFNDEEAVRDLASISEIHHPSSLYNEKERGTGRMRLEKAGEGRRERMREVKRSSILIMRKQSEILLPFLIFIIHPK